jgi:hypothetical protein
MKKSRDFGWTFVSYPLCVEGTDGTVVISILGGTHGYAICCMSVECQKVDISHHRALFVPFARFASRVAFLNAFRVLGVSRLFVSWRASRAAAAMRCAAVPGRVQLEFSTAGVSWPMPLSTLPVFRIPGRAAPHMRGGYRTRCHS